MDTLEAGRHIQLMDTTLRDGEQTQGVSFSANEKVNIARALLQSLKVDRIEVASACVSDGEQRAVAQITEWAAREIYWMAWIVWKCWGLWITGAASIG